MYGSNVCRGRISTKGNRCTPLCMTLAVTSPDVYVTSTLINHGFSLTYFHFISLLINYRACSNKSSNMDVQVFIKALYMLPDSFVKKEIWINSSSSRARACNCWAKSARPVLSHLSMFVIFIHLHKQIDLLLNVISHFVIVVHRCCSF